ncbi:MAG: precorrin-2 C(20)-methyltransferase [Methanobacterium sp.]|nr:precorrin-2 C(20)-methyltransferase [Methanobacterium sp.]
MRKGKLFGVGVGPGDPELLTIKATKTLKEVNVICSPRSSKLKRSLALSIVQPILDERNDIYDILDPIFPMIEDKATLTSYWDDAAEIIKSHLSNGKDVAFITLGDPTIYSTFSYVANRITVSGYDIEIIPGVTSFTGCAAAAGIPLAVKDEIVVIVPKVDDRLKNIMEYGDTFIIMKTSRHSEDLEEIVNEDNRDKTIISVQNCSMDDENIFEGFSKDKKYLSTTIVKFR